MAALVRVAELAAVRLTLLSGLMLGLPTLAPAGELPRLPALALDPGGVTVSGLSSGAYMAGQFEVAYSASVAGAALLAGGAYACSRNSVVTASFACSCPLDPTLALACTPLAADVYREFAESALARNTGAIDAATHLKTHRLWLRAGAVDPVVRAEVVEGARDFYQHLGVPAAQLDYAVVPGAAHGFPAPDAANGCGVTATPFLIHCGTVDAAGELMRWLYPDTAGSAPATVDASALKAFQQARYRNVRQFDGLDASGWVYVPKACERTGSHCRLHVVFHGCEQGQSYRVGGATYGTRFVVGAGYNRWAEAAHIVVLYPQVRAASQVVRADLLGIDPYRYNPHGCWDFWGYTRPFAALDSMRVFATREAPQMKAVKAMIDDLLRSAP